MPIVRSGDVPDKSVVVRCSTSSAVVWVFPRFEFKLVFKTRTSVFRLFWTSRRVTFKAAGEYGKCGSV